MSGTFAIVASISSISGGDLTLVGSNWHINYVAGLIAPPTNVVYNINFSSRVILDTTNNITVATIPSGLVFTDNQRYTFFWDPGIFAAGPLATINCQSVTNDIFFMSLPFVSHSHVIPDFTSPFLLITSLITANLTEAFDIGTGFYSLGIDTSFFYQGNYEVEAALSDWAWVNETNPSLGPNNVHKGDVIRIYSPNDTYNFADRGIDEIQLIKNGITNSSNPTAPTIVIYRFKPFLVSRNMVKVKLSNIESGISFGGAFFEPNSIGSFVGGGNINGSIGGTFDDIDITSGSYMITLSGTEFSGSAILGPLTVLTSNASGVYTLVTNSRSDTQYTNSATGSSTEELAIPSPSFQIGYVGG